MTSKGSGKEPDKTGELAAQVPPEGPSDAKVADSNLDPVSIRSLYRFADCFDFLLLTVGTLVAIVSGVNQPMQLLVFGRILDSFNGVSRSEVVGRIHFFALMYCILGVQQFLTNALQVACFEAVAARQARRAREQYFAALLRRPMSFFDMQDSGALATSVLAATSSWARGIGEEFAMTLQRIVAFLSGLALAFSYSWRLALVVAAGVPVMGFVVAMANKAFQKRSRLSENALEGASSLATEAIGAQRVVAALGQEPRTLQRYGDELRSACRSGIQLGAARALQEGAVSPIMFVMFGLGLWWGSKLVADDMEALEACRWVSNAGTIQDPNESLCHTGGKIMTAFLSILFSFMGLLQALPGVSALAAARGSAAKVFAILDAPPDAINPLAAGIVPEAPALGRVEIVDVVFSYPSRPAALVLRGLRLTVEAGQTVALVGPSGCGKSTVVGLLERFYDPSSGSVLLDGRDLRSLNLPWLRGQIGLVAQEPVLFSGSIRENICLGRDGATFEEVEAATRLAHAFDFISSFPQGFETQVGDKGIQLSGGQKQRIAIARAVVRQPSVLVLDEATSALDTASERAVQAALDDLLRNQRRTTFIIAHRLSTIQNADKIAVLSEGRLVEEGRHAELLSREGGIYRALVAAQLGAGATAKEESDKEHVFDLDMNRDEPTEANSAQDLAVEAQKLPLVTEAEAGLVKLAPKEAAEEVVTPKAQATPVRTPMGWLWMLVLPEKFYFLAGLFGSCITGLTLPALGLLMAEFIVVFFNPDPADMRWKALQWALVFLGMGAAASVGAMLRQYCFAVVTERLSLRVRELAFRAIMRQHIGWFDVSPDRTAGALANRLSQDCYMLKALTGERVSISLSQVVVLFAGLGVALGASWQLTLVVFGIVPGIALPVALQAKVVGRFAERSARSLIDAGSGVSEVILNLRTVAAFGLEAHSAARLSKQLVLPMQQDIRKGVVGGLGAGVAAGVVLLGASFQYFIGGIFFDKGIIEFPNIMRCVLVLIFMAFGLNAVSRGATDKAEATAAAARVHELVSAKSAIDPLDEQGLVPEAPAIGRVEFVDVMFSYPARPASPILRGLCLTIEAGQTVALVGPSGCGKSTVVGLLERFYDPDAGRVLLDGRELRTLNLRWLRGQIGLVSQEPVLFSGSIQQNIALGRPGADMKAVEAAAKLAHAYDFVTGFAAGFETQVGEKGIQLSGGQKQRIAIARAVVRDPAILVLDEATSALDAASERAVQGALDELLKGKRRTTIVIAHRLSTIQNADKIAVIREGQLTEEGCHSELMRSEGGFYRALVQHAGAGAAAAAATTESV